MGITQNTLVIITESGFAIKNQNTWFCRLTDIENRLVVAKGEAGQGRRGRGGKEWEFGISRGKLLYIGWINNKVLLYSTGNYIQYPVTNHNGKEYICVCVCIYIDIYICITESLSCTAEIHTIF